jgi:phage FluMu protein Com
MKNKAYKPALLPKMYCSVFGHNYKVSKTVTYHVKEYTCSHCKKQLTTSSNGTLIELTPKFKEINDILQRIHNSRLKRSRNKKILI